MKSNVTPVLPALNPLPDDIDVHIKRLLNSPDEPALGGWLLELIKNSGHMNSGDDLHWRILTVVWLAMAYDPDQAWPHLMWLNMGQPIMADHLREIFIEAIDALDAHVKMANWQAQATDPRLVTFFQDFHCIPAQHQLQPLMSNLFAQPTRPETGIWLRTFCEATADHDRQHMRQWRLLAAAWYAAAFKPVEGLAYLQTLTNGTNTLSPTDNKHLMDAANQANGLAAMIQIVAGCPDPTVKTLLQDFGHPDLPTVVEAVLDSPPDYSRLSDLVGQAPADAETFKHNLVCLEQAGFSPRETVILDLACGPLAPQTLLFNSAGYKTRGVDLDIPPGYLPLSGVKAWFKRNQHSKAWQAATTAYYRALAQQVDLKLKWNRVKIKLADLTRLESAANSFGAVICANHLQHAPDVDALLAEAARVLKPGGLFLATIRPYAALTGAFQVDSPAPWSHLRQASPPPAHLPLNKWRETQYRDALEKHFNLDQWLPETDMQAQSHLTPEIRAELADFSAAELTRKQIVVVAKNDLKTTTP